MRSHYVSLLSVADSGGTVRDCRGRREEEGGEAEEMRHRAVRASTRHQTAQIEAGILQDFW